MQPAVTVLRPTSAAPPRAVRSVNAVWFRRVVTARIFANGGPTAAHGARRASAAPSPCAYGPTFAKLSVPRVFVFVAFSWGSRLFSPVRLDIVTAYLRICFLFVILRQAVIFSVVPRRKSPLAFSLYLPLLVWIPYTRRILNL